MKTKALNEVYFFFVSRFQRTTGRMIALRRPPAKPPNLPRNPPNGQRPSLSKSVCWMDQTTRLQWRYSPTLYCTHSKSPPDAPSSHDRCAMATRVELQPLLSPAESQKQVSVLFRREHVLCSLFRWKLRQSVPNRSPQTGTSRLLHSTDAAGHRCHKLWLM